MNRLGPLNLSVEWHIFCYGMKVSDSLLSASVLEVCIYATVSDALSHSFAVINERVFWKASVFKVGSGPPWRWIHQHTSRNISWRILSLHRSLQTCSGRNSGLKSDPQIPMRTYIDSLWVILSCEWWIPPGGNLSCPRKRIGQVLVFYLFGLPDHQYSFL